MINGKSIIAPYLDRPLDPDQLKAVEADRNTVVSAGAGSGKTTVLSYRFLRLVLEGKAEADTILTLTFTRKAAAEMHERIHALLAANSDHPRIMEQLQKFNKAQISTLDSFCAGIVRSDSLYYGFPRDFRQDDVGCRKLARETAERMLLFGAENQNRNQNRYHGLRTLLRLYKPARLVDDLLLPIALNFSSPIDMLSFSESADAQEGTLKHIAEGIIDELMQSAAVILDLDERAGKTVQNARLLCTVFSERVPGAVRAGDWQELYALLETLKVWSNSRGKKDALQTLSAEHALWKTKLPLLTLISCSLRDREVMRALADDLDIYREMYISAKQQAGILTFSDISLLAVDVLTRNKTLRDFYKQRFDFIMIDEFQDNNDLQRQLLFLLAEKKELCGDAVPAAEELESDKLFFVGDEKQSIYRFRGADVSVFKKLNTEMERMGGTVLSLKTNYRSNPLLIQAFNCIFDSVMGGDDAARMDYEAEFKPLLAGQQADGRQRFVDIYVHTGEEVEDDPDNEVSLLSGHESEALFIADYITSAVDGERLSVPVGNSGKDDFRPITYTDFALLLNATSNQMIYEKAFRQLGVPYTVTSARALYLEAPLNDIYQLLQLVVYPYDRRAYAALLRSPFAHLSDIAVYRLLDADQFPIFTAAAKSLLQEGSDDEARYAAASKLYAEVGKRADSVPLAELIQYIWFEGGYRWFLLKNSTNHAYLEYYDYMKGLAGNADDQNLCLAEFLDEIRPRLGSNEKLDEMELFPLESPGVQIMTIHKSKGLEFPAVIIADAGNMGKGMTEPLLFGKDPDNGPSISYIPRQRLGSNSTSANFFYTAAKEGMQLQEAAEHKRRLYVGMTRAEQHLMITGCWTKMNQNKSGSAAGRTSFLTMLYNALELEIGKAELRGDSIGKELFRVGSIPTCSEQDWYRARGSAFAAKGMGTQNKAEQRRAELSEDERDRLLEMYTASVRRLFSSNRMSITATALNRIAGSDGLDRTDGLGGESYRDKLRSIGSDAWLTKETAADFGTFCHAVMEQAVERITNTSAMENSAFDIPEFSGSLAEISEANKRLAIDDAGTFANDLFKAKDMRRLLAIPGIRLESEVPFFMRKQSDSDRATELCISGKIDIFAESDDQAFVLDIKTDRYRSPAEYRTQMNLYMEAVREITGKEVKGALIYIRAPEEFVWIE